MANAKIATAKPATSTTSLNPLKSSWLSPTIALLPLLVVGYFQWQSGSTDTLSHSISQLIERPQNNSSSSAGFAGGVLDFEIMRQQYAVQCPDQAFKPHIFSTSPLIIYIENYLSLDETKYLVDLAIPHYKTSPVSKGYEYKAYDKNIRSSESAVLPYDAVVSCIERRSADFQGFLPSSNVEDIQVVKYGASDYFRPHFDWFAGMENPRISTIFGYLECDDCIGGATQFPKIIGKFSSKWCKFVDCEDESDVGGVGFKPVVGNALFWSNLYPNNGTGHPGVWHAGMPVTKGRKVGLNIFTRRQPTFPGDGN